jgi:hypothetical protein
MFKIVINNRLAKACRVTDIGRSPVGVCDRIEGANRLPSSIILKKRNWARDVYFRLSLGDILLLRSGGFRAVSAAIVEDIFSMTKEGRMAM